MVSKLLLVSFFFVFLTGCDKVKETFGFDHYQPDEFNVEQNSPLSLPPDSNLRPPMDKEIKFQDIKDSATYKERAKKIITQDKFTT
jgi:hypothetical protein